MLGPFSPDASGWLVTTTQEKCTLWLSSLTTLGCCFGVQVNYIRSLQVLQALQVHIRFLLSPKNSIHYTSCIIFSILYNTYNCIYLCFFRTSPMPGRISLAAMPWLQAKSQQWPHFDRFHLPPGVSLCRGYMSHSLNSLRGVI